MLLLGVALLTLWGGSVLGSAIPMWEFLSRGEKMSHLFNMFSSQVDSYCDNQSMPDCNKVLLVYGMTNLAKMDDDSLDKMDPYQRGAMDIVWDSMMKGTYKADRDTDTKTEQEDFYSTGSEALAPSVPNAGNGLGTKGEASSIAEYLSPPPGGSAVLPSRFLIGPMVIRVMPDGQPVPGDSQRPLPKDEDAEEFKLMRSKPLPSLSELSRRSYVQQSRPERYQDRPQQSQSGQSGAERYQDRSQQSQSGAERSQSGAERYQDRPQQSQSGQSGAERYQDRSQSGQSSAERSQSNTERYQANPQQSQSGDERYQDRSQSGQSGAERSQSNTERYQANPQQSQSGQSGAERSQSGTERYQAAPQRPAYALPMQYRTLSV